MSIFLDLSNSVVADWFGIKNIWGNEALNDPDGVFKIASNVLNYFIGFAIVVAVVMIVYNGYVIMSSGGDSDKTQSGYKGITAAIVGMCLAILIRIIFFFIIKGLVGV